MGARTRRSLVVAMVVALSAPSVAHARQEFPAFSAGLWVGTAAYVGVLTEPTVTAIAEAPVNFWLRIGSGQVLEGLLTASGDAQAVETGVGASATMAFSMTADISGSADDPVFSGTSFFTGTAQANGIEVPIDFSGGISGSLQPEWATCTQVGGDLGTQVEQAAAAYGMNVSADGVFLATLVVGPHDEDPSTYIPMDYTTLVDDMQKAAAGSVTPAELKAFVVRIEELNAQIVGAALCGDVPAGFEEGLVKDDFFYDQLKAIFDKIMATPDQWSVYDLADFLTTAVRVGAVGAAAPDQAYSDGLLQKFEQVLAGKLAPLDKDVAGAGDAILTIYLAAKQAGLTELADAAKAKLA